MKFIVAASAVLFLAGCGDFEIYRYACQDPANWGSEECQKPLCEVSRTCPEHIFKEDSVIRSVLSEQSSAAAPKSSQTKGGCK
jgi:hypothetical protein